MTPEDIHVEADSAFRTPQGLTLNPTFPRRVLVVGSCLIEHFAHRIQSFAPLCGSDFVLANNFAAIPASPPQVASAYDLQLVQVPLRSILPDRSYFRLSYDDVSSYEDLLRMSEELLLRQLDSVLRWTREYGLLTFFFNFQLPQQNPMGRLLPRYDLRNMVYFIERLNEALERHLEPVGNTHVIDFDHIVATFGRKYFQDDPLHVLSHNSELSDFDFQYDQTRLEPPSLPPAPPLEKRLEIWSAVWNEVVAMYRTIRQTDSVKLVVVDLDDTLWRGVAAEHDNFTPNNEGWPIGLTEALLYLKRRGIMLAIASKNTEYRIRAAWKDIFMGNLELEDFAAVRINWDTKANNVRSIMRQVNVLAQNTVFIDDSPTERAAVQMAFPAIRTLGQHLYDIRRTLLWAAETQVPTITSESARRTEMVQAQYQRDVERSQLSREEFLASLNLKVAFVEIETLDDGRFDRAHELVNKTNQFNTTGRRWTVSELQAIFEAGGGIYAFEVEDRFTHYGLVAAAIVKGSVIEQFVMSCRVIGLGVELTAMAEILDRLQCGGVEQVTARFQVTDANFPARDLFERCGFDGQGDAWTKRLEARSLASDR